MRSNARDAGTEERGATSVRTKPEIITYLKDSFAYMHRAAAAIDEAKVRYLRHRFRSGRTAPRPRLGVAIEDCVHSWDHYGQIVEGLRRKGILPSTSRPATKDSARAPTGTTVSQAVDFWISTTLKRMSSLPQMRCLKRNTPSHLSGSYETESPLRPTVGLSGPLNRAEVTASGAIAKPR